MAVVGGVACGGNVCMQRYDSSNLFTSHNPNARSCCLKVSDPPKPRTTAPAKISPSSLSNKVGRLQPLPKREHKKQTELMDDKIDEWMRDSVAEIVKKLPESPLLVHVYSDNNNRTTKTRMEKPAKEDNWVLAKQKWETGETPMPDGVIFVEQIKEEDEEEETKSEKVSRAWGIVVQGKGEGCGPVAPACYLLKTSNVVVGSGLGLRCTHFCLVRVKSFRETAFSQLKNCWLLQPHQGN
ncbi:hypothetical protein PTKIN_Ptkin16aG0004600 [Pterospermum kingtungense]